MKTIITSILFALGSSLFLQAQSLLGSWQLMKETSCIESEMPANDADIENLKQDMTSMASGRTPKVITFKENHAGTENIRIIDTKKSDRASNFLYKFDGTNLYILDKKSQTIKTSYTVEKLSGDSLVISNTPRPCETKVFIRIK